MRISFIIMAILISFVSVRSGQGDFYQDLACHRGLSKDCLRIQRENANGLLPSGSRLHRGEAIWSPSGEYQLVFQRDGNLVLSRHGTPLWASGTAGSEARECIMQTDGNLVLYVPGHRPVWSSNTFGNPGSFLAVQDDGNVVIYKPVHPVWATGTNR